MLPTKAVPTQQLKTKIPQWKKLFRIIVISVNVLKIYPYVQISEITHNLCKIFLMWGVAQLKFLFFNFLILSIKVGLVKWLTDRLIG